MKLIQHICTCGLLTLMTADLPAQERPEQPLATQAGDEMVAEYFRAETARIERRSLAEIKTLDDWKKRREGYRRELLEMLGLQPLPPRSDLQPKITGKVEQDEFVVEKLYFQSRPGLYVTANLYRPKKVAKPLPAILYVCGHGRVKKDGVSYGNKVHYHHHGCWFARHGYVCLTIDTLQLGEIEGIHHGTYREKMWWWLNRGYTPAGVEAWNCVRALDYLQSRPEVDPERLGVTGRSGGGAYSWWIAAIDDRIKCAVPVAGITDLRNHVVDGCVEGHCDCMFMVNTHRWDYAKVAALVAPRPLLISNTDRDSIFPLDGVYRVYQQTRRIYELYDKADQVALHITAGPHRDTQELRVHAFRWFNHFLKKDDALIERPAVKFFEPENLNVFSQLPADAKNAVIHDSFVPIAKTPPVSDSKEQWDKQANRWMKGLRAKVFAGWPKKEEPLERTPVFDVAKEGIRFRAFDFTSQSPFRLRMYLAHRDGLTDPELVVLNVLDETSWGEFVELFQGTFGEQLPGNDKGVADQKKFDETARMFRSFKWAMAYVAPRGIGLTRWDQSLRKQTQHRRRFYLLGQSLDGMRVYDVRRAVQVLRRMKPFDETPLWLQSQRRMAGVTLYASLFEPDIVRLDLHEMPTTHREGPFLLNVRRILDLPQTVALASAASRVVLYDTKSDDWRYSQDIADLLGRRSLQIRSSSANKNP